MSDLEQPTGHPQVTLATPLATSRLATHRARLLVLQTLATEVMVARMEAVAKRPRMEEGGQGGLASLLAGLGVAGQGEAREVMGLARERLGQAVAQAGEGLLGKPALSHRLEEGQWQEVARLQVVAEWMLCSAVQ